jgi:hypothetical protein
MMAGSHQECIGWSECYNSDFEWTVGNRYLARDLVFGVQGE